MLEAEIENVSEEAVEEVSTLPYHTLPYAAVRCLLCVLPCLFQACRKLLCKLKTNFEKNMEKFQLYSARNIFSCAAEEPLESLSLEERSSCEEITRISDSQIRNQLSQLLPVHEDVQQTCNEAHKLLRERRDASFNVRMRIQAIEDSGVQPMEDVVDYLSVEIRKLVQLVHCLSGEPSDNSICNRNASRVVDYLVSDSCLYIIFLSRHIR